MIDNKNIKMALVQSVDYDGWPMGGTLTYVLNIIPALAHVFELELWGVNVKNNYKSEIVIQNKIYKINKYADVINGKKIVPNAVRVFLGIFKNAEKLRKYDIIFCHTATEFIALKLRLGKHMPFTAYVQHGLNYLNFPNLILKRFIAITGQYAQIHSNLNFIVTDKTSFDEYIVRPEKRKASPFYQVGSPIDCKEIQLQNNRKKSNHARFIFTGRLDKDKQPLIAIEALAYYCEKYDSKAELMIVGDGSEMNVCIQRVKELGVEKNVKFCGRIERNEVIKKLYENDIFLLPSVGEGMSLSSLEALAAGLPVIAFNVTGLRNLINNNENGFLVDLLYDVKAYAEAMYTAFCNLEPLSINAVESSRKYDGKAVAEYMMKCIMTEYEKQGRNR